MQLPGAAQNCAIAFGNSPKTTRLLLPGCKQYCSSHRIFRPGPHAANNPGTTYPSAAVTQSQFGSNAPGILREEEHAVLPVFLIRRDLPEAAEVVRRSEQERGEAEPARRRSERGDARVEIV